EDREHARDISQSRCPWRVPGLREAKRQEGRACRVRERRPHHRRAPVVWLKKKGPLSQPLFHFLPGRRSVLQKVGHMTLIFRNIVAALAARAAAFAIAARTAVAAAPAALAFTARAAVAPITALARFARRAGVFKFLARFLVDDAHR